MILEVAGVSTANKGAELMLLAVKQHFAAREDVELAVEARFGTYAERGAYGLRTKLGPYKPGRSAAAAALAPRSLRSILGLAGESDIAGVLDASGFAFGDQLGPQRVENFARDVARWKRQGKPVVLLPQALGPFETPRVRAAFTAVLGSVDVVYARDDASLKHVQRLGAGADKLRLAPDFTLLVEGARPADFTPPPRMACLVPNHRMVEKTSPAVRERYVPFLAECIRQLRRLKYSPCIVLHDVQVDETLVPPLLEQAGGGVPVIRERDPAKLKGVLGAADVVLGSRFHALVGALSQGVPTAAVGWSHKYEALMSDFGCPDCVLSPEADASQVSALLERLTGTAARKSLVATIAQRGNVLRERVRTMWLEVDALLGLASTAPTRAPASSVTSAREPAAAELSG